jgi:hypothetical protein
VAQSRTFCFVPWSRAVKLRRVSAKPTLDIADNASPGVPDRGMEIGGPSYARRMVGWAAYLALFAVVAGVLTWMFTQFSVPWRIALAIVVFMVSYMLLTAWWTSRSEDRFGSMR